ncbi:uncharacterized protein GVI51_A01001 [Nakaseomyces glabratus]|uniref:Phosphoinositide phospholipase C n=1 Tax=Candida glabrata (strain ATCC 2001 / BCRC 20586 / JCM 3761 / NBRC 0622 / NRRL Y-65 / CBS 138) TaxID=284593 RepID=Q6FY00_CANGA|nr:uncharacterized protein CAGL0A01177g [Nakaseomyces glabratus]KAH7591348.1 EF-hand calcium-binding domain profile [Nakaseomyces glabratus]KAH7609274.1 EF-hand calcium-binding domain profile [Nakaseomyces glabratus]KAH7609684.1 EF-hand calcium-binding domain profile [Nakaseomyces glabratus]KAH7610147.1 EF-hand calcium-binding domain profile [Nakaseomyces glabratus]KAH7615392.1 EF-hand calcium-binding domain profile [Nakaseomyces glabratus]|eukprot:XP_444822.1 uncharacterized protein CAGL0A01177g [[Candida] glabrata]
MKVSDGSKEVVCRERKLSSESRTSSESFSFLRRSNSSRSLLDDILSSSSSTSVKKNLKSVKKMAPFLNYKDLGESIGAITYPYSMAPWVPNLLEVDNSGIKLDSDLERVMGVMREGVVLKKVTRKKQREYMFKLEKNKYITWKDGLKKLNLDSIKSIRPGELGSNYREEYNVDASYSKYWVTIIYKVSNKLKALHVIARDESDYNVFCSLVFGLVRTRRELMESLAVPDHDKFADIHWNRALSRNPDEKAEEVLGFEDVRQMCQRFHIYCSAGYLRRFFDAADTNNSGTLSFEEFQVFVKLLKARKEIDDVWQEAVGLHEDKLTFDTFYKFLTEIQRERMDEDEARHLYERYETAGGGINKQGFEKYLTTSPYMLPNNEDYSRPMNQYYIASSHNTYLTGKQIGGAPSVEGYIQALQQGCRSVEIDMWDGESSPVVCHGVLTSALPLSSVTQIIRKYAFITSPYPLIISMEVRCNSKNQRIAASIFKDTFGDLLYTCEDRSELPSPLELRHRILLKIKKTKTVIGDCHSDKSMNVVVSSSSSSRSSYDESTAMTKTGSRIRRLSFSKRQVAIVDELYELAGLRGVKFRNFSLPESKTLYHCFSLDERRLDKMLGDAQVAAAVDKHNRRHMMRVYPHALRYRSTNFEDPVRFWRLGVQMVATNWQTNDVGHQLNVAMFQLNTRNQQQMPSGYVLKPGWLARPPSKRRRERCGAVLRVTFEVISAQLLPNLSESTETKSQAASIGAAETEDPYYTQVTCEMFSCGSTVEKSSKCHENGFSPVWRSALSQDVRRDEYPFVFVRVVVRRCEEVVATTCVRVCQLREGYRHIPLCSPDGEQYVFSTLFVRYRVTV